MAVDLESPQSVIAFVNQWGRIGVGRRSFGEHGYDLQHCPFDEVYETVYVLRDIQGHAARLQALQTKEWDSPV